MSTNKAGARRRAFTLVSAFVLAAALAVLSSGAGAANKCEDVLGTSTFTDQTNDGSDASAPDISTVVVTSYDGGATSFQISLPGVDAFSSDMIVRTYIDSDKNAKTGDENGYEYMIQTTPGPGAPIKAESIKCEDQPVSALYSWDGSAWVAQETDALSSWFGENSLTIELSGKAQTFDFAVYAASNVSYDESGAPDLSKASSDQAPDSGSYAFPLVAASADLAGVYDVTYRITTSHNFTDLRRGRVIKKSWSFQKRCTKKTCKTKATVKGQGQYRLSRAGKRAYKARAGRKYACNGSTTASGTERFSMNVKNSGWVKGKWRVTKWVGTLNVVSGDNNVPECDGASSYTASLTGTLRQ